MRSKLRLVRLLLTRIRSIRLNKCLGILLLFICLLFLQYYLPRSATFTSECLRFTEQPAVFKNAPRVLFISHEFLGLTTNGGIGTFNFQLAGLLVTAGFNVTLLFTDGSVRRAVDSICKINVYYLGKTSRTVPGLGWAGSRSLEIASWLSQHEYEFDVVHLHDYLGLGHVPLSLKSLGERFTRLAFVTYAHSPSTWARIMNHEPLGTEEFLITDYLERQTVELADALLAPSQYMLDWLRSADFHFPERTLKMPLYLPVWDLSTVGAETSSKSVRHVVFLGRLETRKGLHIFCDALDQIMQDSPALFHGRQISFLGRSGRKIGGIDPVQFIRRKARKGRWSHLVRSVGGVSHLKAMQILLKPGCLSVMPYLEDNSPFAVTEMLTRGVPFISSGAGGIPELVHEADRARVLFPPRADALAQVLSRILLSDSASRARPSWSPSEVQRRWLEFHLSLAQHNQPVTRPTKRPYVSVVLVTKDRVDFLNQALRSLQQQSYVNFEVIVVDDYSSSPEVSKLLSVWESKFKQFRWTHNNETRYVGASRNIGARLAHGDYLFFMDDDNYAKPEELERFVRVASYTNASIITCYFDGLWSQQPPEDPAASLSTPTFGFVGSAISLGLFQNAFGDSNMFVERKCFNTLGGFSEKFDVAYDDWNFLANAVLQGYRLAVIPVALFWKRFSGSTMLHTADKYASREEIVSAYAKKFPSLWTQLHFAQHVAKWVI